MDNKLVWNDGAVERPDGERDWFYIEKDKSDCGNSWIAYTHTGCFGMKLDEIFWIYADEFPQPARPDPHIAPCPFCGGECGLCDNEHPLGFWVRCINDDCGYNSACKMGDGEAITAHNDLCRKLKSV